MGGDEQGRNVKNDPWACDLSNWYHMHSKEDMGQK